MKDPFVPADLRVTRAAVTFIFGVEERTIEEFEQKGFIQPGVAGLVGIQEFGAALLKSSNDMAEKALAAWGHALQVVATVAECGEILRDTMHRLPNDEQGAAAMREVIADHIETMRRFFIDLTEESEPEAAR